MHACVLQVDVCMPSKHLILRSLPVYALSLNNDLKQLLFLSNLAFFLRLLPFHKCFPDYLRCNTFCKQYKSFSTYYLVLILTLPAAHYYFPSFLPTNSTIYNYCPFFQNGQYCKFSMRNKIYFFFSIFSYLFLRSEERRVGKECRSRWS